jgi:hypothetical protein
MGVDGEEEVQALACDGVAERSAAATVPRAIDELGAGEGCGGGEDFVRGDVERRGCVLRGGTVEAFLGEVREEEEVDKVEALAVEAGEEIGEVHGRRVISRRGWSLSLAWVERASLRRCRSSMPRAEAMPSR